MSLISIVETLHKRQLTAEEIDALNEFQRVFGVDNDDPLVVVLAMMARSQLILEGAPNLLQQKVNETIELHRVALREQAAVIAKELIAELGRQIQQISNPRKLWFKYAAFFMGGSVFTLAVIRLAKALLA